MMVSAPDILNASILIVDDQEPNVSLLEQLLSEAGYTRVTSTMNPQEVCALHRKNRYDLILLDLQMPGMDGFQVMEGLKTNEADSYLPVIVLTAQPGHKLRALQAGAKDFVSKPFDLVEVKTRIHNMLEVRLLYKTARELQQGAGTDGAGADRRTARKRSPLSQPDRARLRLVLGAGRERELHQGFRSGPGNARNPGRRASSGDPGDDVMAGLERGGASGAAGEDCGPTAIPGFRVQPRQRRWLAADIPGQRRADVQPGLPLHRLPRNRRRGHRRKIRHRIRSSAMPLPHSPNQNHLLAALPAAEFERLAPHLELVPMLLGEMLYEPGGQLQHVYFPTTAIVSLLYVDGVRLVRRNRGRGQRRHSRHFAVHGRRYHAQLGRRADRAATVTDCPASC